ncbi:MAG: hypothetical protein KatS3mg005_2055 [Bryobacteraceae bacterium]|nr:MAG: hypothetical protein KatS3mg005_2055 [Bryobacteraceae bacterium]
MLTAAARKKSTSQHIAFADIDGVLERYGHILLLEAKAYRSQHPAPIPRGQEITFQTLAAAPRTTVLILYIPHSSISGEFFSPESVTHFRLISADADTGILPTDFHQIETLISRWVRHAEAHPVAIPRPSPAATPPRWARPADAGRQQTAPPAEEDDPFEVLLHD